MNSKTLTLKKPAHNPEHQSIRPEKVLLGKPVHIQTKSKHVLIGTVVSFDSGWLVLDGSEHQWQADGNLSLPLINGRFTFDRNSIQFIAEVNHD